MKGRTYKYLDAEPEYPFGYGLSYTSFSYSNMELKEQGDSILCSIDVTNTGDVDGEEITEIFVAGDINEKAENDKNGEYLGRMAIDNQPRYCLAGFERSFIKKGETKRVSAVIDKEELRTVLSDGSKVLLKGTYTVFAGGSQPDEVSKRRLGTAPLSMTIEL